VTAQMVADEIGVPSLTQQQADTWVRWIEWTEQLIRRRYPDLSVLDQDLLEMVVVGVVAEKAGNPQRVSQVDVQVDDGRVSKRYETHRGALAAILEDWWDVLDPSDSPRRGAWSIPLAYQPDPGGCGDW